MGVRRSVLRVGPYVAITLTVVAAAAGAAIATALEAPDWVLVATSAGSAGVALVAQFAWSGASGRRDRAETGERAWRGAIVSWPEEMPGVPGNVAGLMDPRRRISRFSVHWPLVERLTTWAYRDLPVDLMVIGGASGAGKTRLLLQVAERLERHRDPWRCGSVRAGQEREAAAAALARRGRVLLVVDHWIAPEVLVALVRDLVQGAGSRTRVRLAVTCHAGIDGRWWSSVRAAADEEGADVRELVDEPWFVTPDEWAIPSEERYATFNRAVTDFGSYLGTPVREREPLPALPADAPVADLVAAALATALTARTRRTGDGTLGPEDIWRAMLTHEQQFWNAAARRDAIGLSETACAQLLTRLGLVGSPTRTEAMVLAASVPELSDSDARTLGQVVDWAYRLYAVVPEADDPGGTFPPISPTALAARFLLEYAVDTPLAEAFLDQTGTSALPRTLELLACLATGFTPAPAEARGWADEAHRMLLTTYPERALDAAFDLNSPQLPMDPLLASALTELVGKLPADVVARLRAQLPPLPYARPWLLSTEALIRHRIDQTDEDSLEHAEAWSDLAEAHATASWDASALAAARTSVELLRIRAAKSQAIVTQPLARALVLLASTERYAGAPELAVSCAREAAGLWRKISASSPLALADLTAALGMQAACEGLLRFDVARLPLEQGIESLQQWRKAAPSGALLAQSRASSRFGFAASVLGDDDQAILLTQQAIALAREGLTEDPDNSSFALIDSLSQGAGTTAVTRDHTQGQAWAAEAVTAAQQVPLSDPARPTALVEALAALAYSQRHLGHSTEANLNRSAALRLAEEWLQTQPRVARPSYLRLLADQASELRRSDPESALNVLQNALELCNGWSAEAWDAALTIRLDLTRLTTRILMDLGRREEAAETSAKLLADWTDWFGRAPVAAAAMARHFFEGEHLAAALRIIESDS